MHPVSAAARCRETAQRRCSTLPAPQGFSSLSSCRTVPGLEGANSQYVAMLSPSKEVWQKILCEKAYVPRRSPAAHCSGPKSIGHVLHPAS